MDAKKKKSIVIWVSVAALLGVGGYFAYTKLIKPKLDEMKAKKAAEEAAKAAASLGSTPAPTSGSTPSGGGSSSAPLNRAETEAFQEWMDKNRPNWVGATNDALNNGKQLNRGFGFGNFGSSTTKAFAKYGSIWRASLTNEASTAFNAIGKNAFPKTGYLYANVWKVPQILSYDTASTFAGQINQPNVIGKIINATMLSGVLWYQVNLLTPLSRSTASPRSLGEGNPNAKTGWVLANQITIK
jgi:hypothetical protein